ncbi:hypothetical protein V6N12_020048 [Hibiscus sabdariffa]|uniref:Copia-type polyprotein n=1 Tax=Hibiscus sabdariffa TaxID=183260 RepID=A0ABR2B6G1_9ROSI
MDSFKSFRDLVLYEWKMEGKVLAVNFHGFHQQEKRSKGKMKKKTRATEENTSEREVDLGIWGSSYAAEIACDLEWDGHLDEETTLEQNEYETTSDIDGAENHDSNSSIEEGSTSSNKGRSRVPPVWMRDYVTGEELSENDKEAHFLMLATTDPFRFEDAVKEEKWRKAMDAEIEAIERNGT